MKGGEKMGKEKEGTKNVDRIFEEITGNS